MSEEWCGFLHWTEAINVFTQSGKLLTKVGSVPIRAGMSDEISIENTSSVTRGKLVKHLTASVGAVVLRGYKTNS